jgi:4a-hydroxytetrahydrobiopterin dehydratase
VARLSNEEIGRELASLSGWTREGDAIRKQFALSSFPDAVAFAVRVAFDAETADHHPEIRIDYKHVTLLFSTHSAGGLTAKDFDGARAADYVHQVLRP